MKKYIILISSMLFLTACSNYLDVKPYDKVIPKTPQEFSALLSNQLNSIASGSDANNMLGGILNAGDEIERFSDNLDPSLMLPDQVSILYAGDRIDKHNSKYSIRYEVIRDCNIIMDEFKEDSESKELLGLAYAMRGVSYYMLLKEFCDAYDPSDADQLGLPLVETFDMEARINRSSYKETILFIEKDLKKSLEYGVNNPDLLFTEDVIKAYLARLYFWTHNWGEAIKYSSEIIDKYPLVDRDGFKEMMTSTTEMKGNVILKTGTIYNNDLENMINNFLIYIKEAPVRKSYIDIYTDKENDIRYTLYFNDKRGSIKRPFVGIRTAEMYLIRAESYYHNNQPDLALADINELRSKRIFPYIPLKMDELEGVKPNDLIQVDAKGNKLTPLMNTILQERRRELFMEKDRWFELKRNGKPSFWAAKGVSKFITEPYMYTFPIPIQDVELTPGMLQNEGYITTN